MKLVRLIPVIAVAALAAASGWMPLRAQTAPSGAATHAAQVAAGEKAYNASCSGCHGANLRGVVGPALIGDAFTAQWTGEPASDVFTMMSGNMPLGAGGSLKPAEYLAIMAYILQKNDIANGSAALTATKLTSIKLVSPPT